MGKFKTNKANTKSGSIALVCGIFIIIGIVLIVLPNLTDIADWVGKFGIALIVLATPVIAFIVYDILKRKVKEM
jgi:hypothetical protein